MPNPNPNLNQLAGVPGGLAAARLRHSDTFLAGRGLNRAELDRLLRLRTGEARHLLLTSSPVHGLANATSDLDFIRVQQEEPAGARMATQFFEGGHHLEAISFGVRETAAALADLATLAAEPPAAVVAGHRGWDKSRELRRKYLERLVNGVDLEGGSPYLEHLPPLARVWKWASLHTAVEQVFFLRLAEQAGESRGRAGYALGALLHLMDALLSHHGDVFSNRKWYLLRWRRLTDSGALRGTSSAEAADLIEALRSRLSAALTGQAGAPLAPAFTELLECVFTTAGEGHRPALLVEPVGRPVRSRFLPGAELLLGDAAVFLGAGSLPEGRIDVAADDGLPGDPGDVLRAARGGALRLLPA
ncbi:DUF6001 family protein [Kitasatospora sp. NBC_01266]|uniref:DUF6001 family protein n=1 Tax=Kitasatospora sp. NBC_01266 TaxID=2903572 RepID=UPI002E317EEB|nr:DUF6001 family protein [Kitasatospora sp. NBC_01266]